MNAAEKRFALFKKRQGKTCVHQPGPFALPAPFYSYRPDFYVPDEDCYYEVVGSRQAFSQIANKIIAFRRAWPGHKLEVFNMGAWAGKGPDRIVFNQVVNKSKSLGKRLRMATERPDATAACKRLVHMIQATRCRNTAEFCRFFDLHYPSVTAILRGSYPGNAMVQKIENKFCVFMEDEIDLDNIKFRMVSLNST